VANNLKSVHIPLPFCIPLTLSILGVLFVPFIAFKYGYSTLFFAASGMGFLVLVATSAFLGWAGQRQYAPVANPAVILGLPLGVLWVIEISINNFFAPPLPARDIIDNIFWAVIAISIFIYAIISSQHSGYIRDGIRAGFWSGSVSGLFACWMALAVIVFAMTFITHDPLNIAEWAARGAENNAPSMAAYFAYETMAGAFMHLIVLGVGMGGMLGLLGGIIGKVIKVTLHKMLRPA
jgi:hypothetical protein